MNLPELGIGIVYVPGLEPLLEPGNTSIDVIEIEPQTFWTFKSRSQKPYFLPNHTLKHLQSLPQRKIIHSVGFAVGGTQRPESAFVDALSETIQALDAPWASEHLSFTHVGSNGKKIHTNFMLPPLQTEEGAAVAARTIRELSSQLPVPFAVETSVNYLKPRKGELTDGEFVALTVESAGCGILLDLHNIWTNERNGRQKVNDFLAAIPLDQVWEIHLGGGFEFDGYWLDAHSGAVPEQVFMLTEELMPALPNLKAVIYEIFPSFMSLFGLDAIQKQLENIKDVWNRTHRKQYALRPPQILGSRSIGVSESLRAAISPSLWEETLGELIMSGRPEGILGKELENDKSIPLMRKLIWRFRAGAVIKTLPILIQLILLHAGNESLETILSDYFNQSKPEPFASEEAKGFMRYLRKKEPDIPYIKDILSYEEATIHAAIEQSVQCVRFRHDPRILLQTLLKGYIPQNLAVGSYELEVSPEIYST